MLDLPAGRRCAPAADVRPPREDAAFHQSIVHSRSECSRLLHLSAKAKQDMTASVGGVVIVCLRFAVQQVKFPLCFALFVRYPSVDFPGRVRRA